MKKTFTILSCCCLIIAGIFICNYTINKKPGHPGKFIYAFTGLMCVSMGAVALMRIGRK